MAAAYASAKLGDDSRLDELGLALRQGGEPTRWMAAELLTELLDDRLAAARAGGSDVAAAELSEVSFTVLPWLAESGWPAQLGEPR